jgi:NADH-quinone oxidoreductase subunit N|tara:strand:- start:11827 stop:13275 length:1449 start_codon:yes stop_codon:yes gene_type:complete
VNILTEINLIWPELCIALSAMCLLMIGAFRGDSSNKTITWVSICVMGVACLLVLLGPNNPSSAFNNLFIVDQFSNYSKILILMGAILTLILALPYNLREGIHQFEFPILLLFSVLGMMMMVSANDLIALYLGIELQSLSLYVLAAIRRDSIKSAEAGLKYFVLGALSSGILLYGMTMVYGFTGATGFNELELAFSNGVAKNQFIGVTVGLVFILCALAFKVSAVPFHMWTPDVYEGAPTPITAFFSIAPKIAAMILLSRVLLEPFGGLFIQWQQVICFISIASMAFGAFAAINQTNIKRLMAYSSIGHMGFVLVGLASGSIAGLQAVLLYLTVYLFMNVGTFACILAMKRDDRMVEEINQLAGLSRTNPKMTIALTVFMFSMAGIPPLAGFFGKYFVFKAAIDAELYTLTVIGLLASVVSAFYYLRIVKLMYFDEAVDKFDRSIGKEISFITIGMSFVTTLFIIILWPVLDFAAIAASSIFL